MDDWPTSFIEANALLAVISKDHEQARRIIAGMPLGEQQSLALHAVVLAGLCAEPARIRHALDGACRWSYCCARPVVGYYRSGSDRFRGICAHHKPDAQASEIHVYDAPTQVTP
jgi:hypothetical protein